MNIFKKVIGYIQPHIVTVFSVLLFLSFSMVGLVFNLTIHRYISEGAEDALREARVRYEQFAMHNDSSFFMRVLRGNHRFMYAHVRVFSVDANYMPRDILISYSALEISEKLSANPVPMVLTERKRMRLDDGTFFISIVPHDTGALIFYFDVSDVLSFTAVVNRLLLISVVAIWLIAMIIASRMADFTMKPLRALRDFVMQIGRGDFTPNEYTFINEDFSELNKSLNNAARQLAEHDNAQKIFFQNVSHELRTPLMIVKSYAEGINMGIMDPCAASATIMDSANQLANMVDDILYVSRMESIAIPQMENTNLCALVAARVDKHRPLADNAKVSLEYKSDGETIIARCIPPFLERAVDNMISNAIRYAKTRVKIECIIAGSVAKVCVVDDGSGFDPAELPHVFERFFKGKNGLTGIGLATVKSIAEQHDGDVTAENGIVGAILTITIPYKG
ncbi:MAG: HAMP domain-containing histidine kinase [Defluviitaleaceae bacterium]|nr:HAMP domain-containing histidine kinase [Defluviitaleaceae bacterium]